MDNRKTILEELVTISPLVAGIPPVNPYTVPAGYFDSIAGRLQEAIGSSTLPSTLQVGKTMPFDVPTGYFEGFAASLLMRIRSIETSSAKEELEKLSPLLNKLDKQTPFTTPEGYFTELADNLVSGMKAIDFVKEELETPLLKDLKNRPVYSVPPRYFEEFPATVLNRIQGNHPARIVKMRPLKRMMQYAAAAAVTAILITGTLFINQQGKQTPALALNQGNDSIVSRNISKLSDEAIVNYVENEAISLGETAVLTTSSTDIDEEDMREMLVDIPYEELNRYVEMHGGEKFITN